MKMLRIKNILLLSILSSTMFLSSCDEEEEIVEELSFEVDGTLVSFMDPDAGLDFFDRLVVNGIEGEEQGITIGVLNSTSGTFTKEDIDLEAALLTSNYFLDYTDEKGNSYSEFSDESSFSITVDEFADDEDGLVTGTFSGTLYGSLLNGSAAADHVVITNGIFNVKRSDTTLENIY